MQAPNHIAVVPNGNRRKQAADHITLTESYLIGAARALDVVNWSFIAGSKHVTFFGLSCENLERRPEDQIDALMQGAIWFCDQAIDLGCHVHAFGHIEEFADKPKYEALYVRLRKLQSVSYSDDDFVIHVAANYSGKAKHELGAVLDAAYHCGHHEVRQDPERYLLSAGVPPVDLFIRTGGEHRISGLLPFQVAYAELRFLDVLWADLTQELFNEQLFWFARQTRNFGK